MVHNAVVQAVHATWHAEERAEKQGHDVVEEVIACSTGAIHLHNKPSLGLKEHKARQEAAVAEFAGVLACEKWGCGCGC